MCVHVCAFAVCVCEHVCVCVCMSVCAACVYAVHVLAHVRETSE